MQFTFISPKKVYTKSKVYKQNFTQFLTMSLLRRTLKKRNNDGGQCTTDIE